MVSPASKDIRKRKSPRKVLHIKYDYPAVIANRLAHVIKEKIKLKILKSNEDEEVLAFVKNNLSTFAYTTHPIPRLTAFRIIFFGYDRLTSAEKKRLTQEKCAQYPQVSPQVRKRLQQELDLFLERDNYADWVCNRYKGNEESKAYLEKNLQKVINGLKGKEMKSGLENAKANFWKRMQKK